ncbi:MAG: hypothetical protein M5U26_03460 [Planctomycetota bacterium]|nr:hypothetical protein [Planctomycetota bacterium]
MDWHRPVPRWVERLTLAVCMISIGVWLGGLLVYLIDKGVLPEPRW